MNNDITHYAKKRHACKAYDASKKIPAETVAKMKELLRFSASSVNSQPWHFIIASTDEGKDKVAKAASDEKYPFNSPSIRGASHVVVFCARKNMDEAFLLKLLAQEEKDGRFAGDPETFKPQWHQGRSMFVNMHKEELKDIPTWLACQTYLNIGSFLLGVAALGLDATPMEGADPDGINKAFGLKEKGYSALAVVCVGYRDEDADFNAKLPKSRLTYEEIMTEI